MPDFTTHQAAGLESVTITGKRSKEGESHPHNQQPIFNNNSFEPKLSVMFSNEGISAQVIAVSPLNLLEGRELQTSEDSYQVPFMANNKQSGGKGEKAAKNLPVNSLNSLATNLDMNQPARSWWRYFRKLKEENRAICLTCGQSFNRGAKQSTTSLSHHLKMYHRNIYITIQQARDEHAAQTAYGNAGPKNKAVANFEKIIDQDNDDVIELIRQEGNGGEPGPSKSSITVDDFQWLGASSSRHEMQIAATKQLIRAIREFPELYTTEGIKNIQKESAEGSNKQVDEVWKKVQVMVNLSGQSTLAELKRRWHHLYEKFKKELRIALRDNFAYQPKWPHFKEMIWLAAHIEEFKGVAHLLDGFISGQSQFNTKLEDLLLPFDFEEVLGNKKQQNSKRKCQNACEATQERLLKQELDEQELREVATALGIDIAAVETGELHRELDGVDTSFLMDKNGCCPSREAIQTIGYMLQMGDKATASAVGGDDISAAAEGHEDCGACGNDGMEADKDGGISAPTICGCSCTRMDDSSDDEGIGHAEREFGRMVARRLTAMDTETRERTKEKITRLLPDET